MAALHPFVPDLPFWALQYERWVDDTAGAPGALGRRKGLTLNTVHDGRLLFPAGLVPRMKKALAQLGYEVEVVVAGTPLPRMTIDDVAVERLVPHEAEFVQLLGEHRLGLITADRIADRASMVVAAARAYPRASITVATASRSTACAFWRRLDRRLREPVSLMNKGGLVRSEARIRVCTYGSFDEDVADLVFFPEATDAITMRYVESLVRLHHPHVFGFIGSRNVLGAHERFWLEGLFGEVIYKVPSPTGYPAEVRVLLVETPAFNVPVDLTGLDRKRLAVWSNDRRNATIADVAKALATGDEKALHRHGPGLVDLLDTRSDPLTPRVSVLVESPEHGWAQRRLLPGWTLLERRSLRAPAVMQDDDHLREEDFAVPNRSILTLLRVLQVSRLELDVLIRADGGPWPLDLPDFPPRVPGDVRRRIVLIDFMDGGDPCAREFALRRVADYHHRGWEIERAADGLVLGR